MAWHRLRPERATIKVFGGPVYAASETLRTKAGVTNRRFPPP